MYTNTTLITLLILSIILSSCSEEKIIENKKEVNKLELEVKLDTIKITEDGPKSYQIYSGQILTYEFIDYPSTGAVTSFKLSSENLIIKDTLYRPINESEKNSTGEVGGDETEVTFIFQGKKSGKCQLQINHFYRADNEKIVTLEILIN